MLKGVFFDLDDTLYDEMQFVKEGFRSVSLYISKNHGINQNIAYKLLLDSLEKYGRGYTFDIVLKKFDLFSKKLILRLLTIYRTHRPKLSLYSGARLVLTDLKKQGYKLALITDGNVAVQRSKIEALKLKRFFKCIVISDKYGVKRRKPHHFPFKKALKILNVHADETIYVGDNPYKDFVNAKRIGMHTVRIMRGQYKNININKEHDSHFRIDNLNELFGVVKLLNNRPEIY